METRLVTKSKCKTKKIPDGPVLISIEKFKDGVLPIKKDVIQRVMNESDTFTQTTASKIAKELVSLWTYYM